MFYKITDAQAKSCHGGDMDWTPYLPKYKHTKECLELATCPVTECQYCEYQGKWKAGKWYKHKGELQMCYSGIHLTSEPLRWFKRQSRIFTTENRGIVSSDNSDKCCFSEVRLTAECGYGHIVKQVSIFKALSSDADLRDADLRGANLRDANLRDAYLRDANLRDANLRDAYLRDAYLRDANLRDANLRDAYLRGADLRGADLRGTNLMGADLGGADLMGADLGGADLTGTNLRDANLMGADLRGAYFNTNPNINGYTFKNGRIWRDEV